MTISRREFNSLVAYLAIPDLKEMRFLANSIKNRKNFKLMKSCLFVIDIQNGFISEKTAHVQARILSLLEQDLFDYVLFTRFLNTTDSPYVRYLGWNKLVSEEERELVDSVKPYAKTVFNKTTYTAINQETLSFIKHNNIEIAFVLGIDTDCCVLNTAVDLFENNIRPYVLEYYSASNGGGKSHESAIVVLNRLVGRDSIIREALNPEKITQYLARATL